MMYLPCFINIINSSIHQFINSSIHQKKTLNLQLKNTNMKRVTIFLLMSVQILTAQNPIDSLNNLIKTTDSDIRRLELLCEKNQIFINTSADSLIENSRKIIKLAKVLNKPDLMSESYRYIAEAGLRKHNFDMAKQNAEKALQIDDSLHRYADMILDYNQLGRSYYNFGQPEKAINIYKKAVAVYEKNPVGNKIGTIYGNIGAAYNLLNRPNDALKYFLKQADFIANIDDPLQKSKVNYNIGYTYMQLEQFNKGEKYFLEALKDSAKIEVKDYVYVNYHALGMLYSRWNKLDKALESNKIALKFFDATQNKMYQFDLHNNNAAIYLKKGEKQLALQEADKAFEIAKQIGFKLGMDAAHSTKAEIYVHFGDFDEAEKILKPLKNDSSITHYEIKLSLYNSLYEVDKHKKDYKEALFYHEKLKKLNDSILKAQRDSKIAEVETRYQTEKKEKENLKLKAEKARQDLLLAQQSKRNTYLTAGILIALTGLGIFAFFYRRNKRQKELIEHLQKDLHHRIKNNLAVIDALIEDIKDEFDNTGIHNKLNELQNRINSINEIHRQLYFNKDITHLNLKNYLDKISRSIQESFGNNEVVIQNKVPENFKLEVNTSFPIGLIVNEFLTNSFKYAFDKQKNPKINIELTDKGRHYLLKLSDNGKGLPENLDIDNLDSFGLSIMKLLAQQLRGTFRLKNHNGVQIEIEFPKRHN